MASITSLSGNNTTTSSIYGSRNVLSGLASGMDTESMIENAVSGYKYRITRLQQQYTKVGWQQEAYRSIIDKLVDFNTKYTSYSSKTNLLSNSFFTNSVTTDVLGTNAAKIAATGKSSSDIKISAVKQLAAAASYTVAGLAGSDTSGEILGSTVDLAGTTRVSNVSGVLSLKYGGTNGTSFDLTFDELEDISEMEGDSAAEKMANAIRKKLSEIDYSYTKNGFSETTTADKAINVSVENGEIKFSDGLGNGNSISVSMATDKLAETLGIKSGDESIQFTYDTPPLAEDVNSAEYLSGKELSFSLNGVTKKIKLGSYDSNTSADSVLSDLQSKLDSAFGKGKIQVGGAEDSGKFSLKLNVKEIGSTLSVSGSGTEAIGLSEGAANYVDTGKKITSLLGDRASSVFTEANRLKGVGSITSNGDAYVDEAGNRVDKDGYRLDKEGNAIYDFKVNGVSIGVTENTTLESLMNSINSNVDAGVKVSYSKMTNEFKFTSTETGSNSRVEFDNLGKALFGDTTPKYADKLDETGKPVVGEDGKVVQEQISGYTAGKDAILTMEVNGKVFEDLVRSSNNFDVDGMNITLKGEFTTGKDEDAVTFNTKTDSDKIVEAITNFVNDYNEMMTEVKNAYSTQPLTDSKNQRYEPLTDEDRQGMSESAIAQYEEKAKTGILFADSDLSSLYGKMLDSIAPGGTDGQTLREIGIKTSYSGGMTTLSLDEDALRAALESNPDKVRSAFTKTVEGGSSSNGLMMSMQNTLNTYVKTTGEPKGVLITHAGSTRAPTSIRNNSLYNKMDNIQNQIERWQDKMSDQIDRYTQKFTKLETLIAQMNSQAGSLAGLMGGAGGY